MKLQFSLRTLMIVVTLLAVPLGYVGWQAKIVREREAADEARRWALQRVRELGGGPISKDATPKIAIPFDTSLEDRRAIVAALPEFRIVAFRPPIRLVGEFHHMDWFSFDDDVRNK